MPFEVCFRALDWKLNTALLLLKVVKVPVLFSFTLTTTLQFAKDNEPWDLA